MINTQSQNLEERENSSSGEINSTYAKNKIEKSNQLSKLSNNVEENLERIV